MDINSTNGKYLTNVFFLFSHIYGAETFTLTIKSANLILADKNLNTWTMKQEAGCYTAEYLMIDRQ